MPYTSTLKLFRRIRDEIKPLYGHEAEMLAMYIVEDVSGFSSTHILIDQQIMVVPEVELNILNYIEQLKKHKPIQYILGKAHFYENIFEVNKSTLIPRPETEGLVRLVLQYLKGKEVVSLLDIGVGSGCIAISIALNQPKITVEGIEVSPSALAVAKRNAERLGATVNFFLADIFTYKSSKKYDIIISNPPYVRESEKLQMNKNVLNYEPSKALFVTDSDPLVFYKQIIEFSNDALADSGAIFFEVNELLANEVADLMRKRGFYQIEIFQDMNEKNRFVFGKKQLLA